MPSLRYLVLIILAAVAAVQLVFVALVRPSTRANLRSSEYIVVTATSANHFKPLLFFITQFRLFEPNIRLVVYDLGLNACQRNLLSESEDVDEFRTFDYSKYPAHFDLNVAIGEYAWKPAIINEVLQDFPTVLWLDSGDYLQSKLDPVWPKLKNFGFYTSPSAGNVKTWVHAGTKSYLGVDSKFDTETNCNGAVVGFVRDTPAFEKIFRPWYQCALNKDCIAPAGSSRANHRQDQAALTVLVYRSELPSRCFCDESCVTFGAHNFVDGIGQWSDKKAERSIQSPCPDRMDSG
jgi:hypothetical protein